MYIYNIILYSHYDITVAPTCINVIKRKRCELSGYIAYRCQENIQGQ